MQMKDREVLDRLGAVAFIVGGVLLAATLAGKSDFALPLFALAWWLSLLLVIRPYLYERNGRKVGDWMMVILMLGPLALLVAPILWWEHRGLEPGA